jgi:hypothetical protein
MFNKNTKKNVIAQPDKTSKNKLGVITNKGAKTDESKEKDADKAKARWKTEGGKN